MFKKKFISKKLLMVKVAHNDPLDSSSPKNWPGGQRYQGCGVVLWVQKEVYQSTLGLDLIDPRSSYAFLCHCFSGRAMPCSKASQFLSIFKVGSENILILFGSSCSELFRKTLLLKKTFQKLILCCFEGFNAYFHNTVSAFRFRND